MAGDDDDDLHVPTTWETIIGWFGPSRSYVLTRWLILRLLGVVYLFAFLGLIYQGLPLLGSHGLTPIGMYVDRLHAAGMTFWDVPTLFMFDASDTMIQLYAYIGLALALCLVLGYANLPSLLVMWAIYGSFERVGQLWFSFGWEIQLLETTLVAACLVHPWDPRPLASRAPPVTGIVLMRWLVVRIMLGAGLIKLRGDPCWKELTCLDWHFETQPIPNPLSAWFHHLPHAVHAAGVVFNHLVEVVAPWFVFGPRRLRLIAGVAMALFQVVLIVSGNLAFLNWLTLVPILACFDDDALRALLPRRLAARVPVAAPRDGRQLASAIYLTLPAFALAALLGWIGLALGVVIAVAVRHAKIAGNLRTPGMPWDVQLLLVGAFAALVIVKSVPVVDNLLASHQAMNRNYDRLALVNTYGAFGSVGAVRHELVIEGTLAADPEAPDAEWRAYELPCKPGDLTRRPCVLGPYHRRLDWLIWFSAMEDEPGDPWIVHLVWKLLDGDRTVRELIAVDPFGGTPPRWVRVRRFVYHLAPPGAPTVWTRDSEQPWLPPLSRDSLALHDALAQFGWPSPSDRD